MARLFLWVYNSDPSLRYSILMTLQGRSRALECNYKTFCKQGRQMFVDVKVHLIPSSPLFIPLVFSVKDIEYLYEEGK